jgi:hypothetical protein
MNPFWPLFLAALWKFLGPYFEALWDDLFRKAAVTLGEPLPNAKLAVEDLFDAAIARTRWWWDFRTRARLAVCRKLAVNRAEELWAAAKGGPEVVQTKSEAKEIAAAL